MSLLSYIRKAKDGFFVKQNQLRLRKNGEEAIQLLSTTINRQGGNCSPFFGTLLGVYRDNDFIKYDDDIDVTMNVKCLNIKLLESLSAAGFHLSHISMASDFRGAILSMKFKKIVTEIYFYYESQSKQYIYIPYTAGHDWRYYSRYNLFPVKEVVTPLIVGMVEHSFRNGHVLIPQNTDSILQSLYGSDYMTPIRNKKGGSLVEGIPWIQKRWHVVPMYMIDEDILSAIRGE